MPRLHGCTLASKALLSRHGFWSGLCTVAVPFKCLLIGAQIDMCFVQEVNTGSYLCWVHALLSNRLICYQEIQSTYNMDSNKGNFLYKVQVY